MSDLSASARDLLARRVESFPFAFGDASVLPGVLLRFPDSEAPLGAPVDARIAADFDRESYDRPGTGGGGFAGTGAGFSLADVHAALLHWFSADGEPCPPDLLFHSRVLALVAGLREAGSALSVRDAFLRELAVPAPLIVPGGNLDFLLGALWRCCVLGARELRAALTDTGLSREDLDSRVSSVLRRVGACPAYHLHAWATLADEASRNGVPAGRRGRPSKPSYVWPGRGPATGQRMLRRMVEAMTGRMSPGRFAGASSSRASAVFDRARQAAVASPAGDSTASLEAYVRYAAATRQWLLVVQYALRVAHHVAWEVLPVLGVAVGGDWGSADRKLPGRLRERRVALARRCQPFLDLGAFDVQLGDAWLEDHASEQGVRISTLLLAESLHARLLAAYAPQVAWPLWGHAPGAGDAWSKCGLCTPPGVELAPPAPPPALDEPGLVAGLYGTFLRGPAHGAEAALASGVAPSAAQPDDVDAVAGRAAPGDVARASRVPAPAPSAGVVPDAAPPAGGDGAPSPAPVSEASPSADAGGALPASGETAGWVDRPRKVIPGGLVDPSMHLPSERAKAKMAEHRARGPIKRRFS